MEYESLESHIDCQLADLPEAIRTAMTPTLKMFWDELLPDGRRSQAQQHDFENDPAREPERKYWWNLVRAVGDTGLAITKWEKTNDGGTPSEALIRETKLAALGDRLANLKRMYKLPPFLVEDPKALTDDALTKLVNDSAKTMSKKAPGAPGDGTLATPNWKMRIQVEASALVVRLRKSGASPTRHSILDTMATWCRDNNVMTDGKIFPSANYLRTHVLGGKHWDVPN